MSCNYYVFIGPYLQVHNPLRDGVKQIDSCPNQKCSKHKNYSSDSFCSKCGSAIGEVSVPCKERKVFDIYTEFGEKEPLAKVRGEGLKIEDDYVLYTSNKQKGPGCTLSDDAEIIPMTPDVVQKDMDTMRAFHAKEIARLQEVFGNVSVQIKWGVITYWS